MRITIIRGHITSRSQGRGRIETCRGEKSFLKARCHCMSSPDFGPLEDPYCRVLKHDILARLASLCNRQVTVQNKSIGKAKGCAISQTACEFNLSIGTIFFAVYRGSVMQVHNSIRSEVVWEYQLLMERTQFTGSVVSIANRYHLRDILFEDGRVIE